ncbi:two-component system sensor histidine kinase NtrB [Profundibacter sp.]|uniref:two-component system sensor histidine kinase NtrB n=1 Tax=Profundibacter sp. TaxID=3101071 RepID=UPI003D0A2FD4
MSFASLWNALPTPALLIGEDNEIIAANPSAEGFLVTSAKSLKGKQVDDRLTINAPLLESIQRVRRTHGPLFINDIEAAHRGHAPQRCNIQITPMAPDDPRLLMLIIPRQNKDGGGGPASKSAAKSAIGMAEMLAHEIKNPLAGITGAAQLLAMNLPPQDLEMTDLIVSEARRIVALLDQVEQFGNLSPPNRRVVNIHDVVDRARISAQVGFAAHMTIIEEYDPSLPPTWADADQLMQVVLNLLKNAAEAAPKAGGVIRIRTAFDNGLRLRRSDGSGAPLPILVEIIDNGPGLPSDIADDVFDPFVSGRENGTGLGLALVSKIIAEHEGWISVESEPGHTVFRISLPKAPAETPAETGAE